MALKRKSIINRLKQIALEWPDDLWIYCADGRLYLMGKSNGTRAITHTGGVDPEKIIAEFDIESDGGDW